MVVDTSAIVAIVMVEPEAARFAREIVKASVARVSAANAFEAAIVLDSRGDPVAVAAFERLLQARLLIEPVTERHYHLTRDAFRRFGKGNHPAGLNFGDCFAYALAVATGEPLLFKGCDFDRTDVRAAA